MQRNIDINEISDGNKYNSNSLVKISCNDCNGCSKCCQDMGDSIILDPYDIYQLTVLLCRNINSLLECELELGVVDGLIQPHIKMQEKTKSCAFLNSEGRCSIHQFRSGFCRLFPLGRIYTEDNSDFDYFHQIHECPYPDKSKIKIKNWLGIPELGKYENYIKEWHRLLKKLQELSSSLNEQDAKNLNIYMLKVFYLAPYDSSSFYEQFDNRYRDFIQKLGL